VIVSKDGDFHQRTRQTGKSWTILWAIVLPNGASLGIFCPGAIGNRLKAAIGHPESLPSYE
jgi:hypothetical protein